MAHPIIEKGFRKFAFFSRNFSTIFQIFINVMHIFEKLRQILGLCKKVKFRSNLEKSDPPPKKKTFGGPPKPKNPACITAKPFSIPIKLLPK